METRLPCAGTADPAEENGSGRRAAVGVPVPGGRPGLEANATWRVCFGAGCGGGVGAGAGAAATGAARLEIADPRGTGGGVPRAARRRAGDAREAGLAAREGGRCLRRSTGRRAAVAGDRGLADRTLAGLPVRRHPGAAAGAGSGGALGDDRRQPGEARRGQPAAAAQGAAPVRVMGRTRGRRRESQVPLCADGDLRGCDRASPSRMARVGKARRRSRGARRLCPPLVHEGSVEVH
jgi:hypothetical protein